ncbi:MAG: DUF1700 domain-containing protein [Megasphaera sp.]|jgi:hypothetical protein|nr:DUF1700 domain-containing protein [Megasphaera sp.]MCH4188132.1 DUF1700 domain-containing protein [Megasphaera sp.]MCH4217970.1 DUF1700 domain-containing protein [Megasphaera sp.]
MRKTEFMDLLKYYFRKSDKGDLKGILEDCEEQFRLGSKEGKSEEEICCKLGHPKNIYRYYIGQPVIPEDNPRMPGAGYGNFEDFGPGQTQQNNLPYDWDKSPERQQRHAESESYYRQPPACDNYGRAPYDDGYGRRPRQQPLHYEEDTKTGQDFDWGNDDSVSNASKAVARPFLDILGTLFSILSSFLYLALTLVVIAAIGISFIPPNLFTDLLPLPTISMTTRIFAVLAVLFAAMTATYASQACHASAHSAPARTTRRGA